MGGSTVQVCGVSPNEIWRQVSTRRRDSDAEKMRDEKWYLRRNDGDGLAVHRIICNGSSNRNTPKSAETNTMNTVRILRSAMTQRSVLCCYLRSGRSSLFHKINFDVDPTD